MIRTELCKIYGTSDFEALKLRKSRSETGDEGKKIAREGWMVDIPDKTIRNFGGSKYVVTQMVCVLKNVKRRAFEPEYCKGIGRVKDDIVSAGVNE